MRFGEFNDEWNENFLNKFFDNRNERNYETLEVLSVTINDGVLKRSELGSDRTNKDKKTMKHVLKGDLVYNPMFMWKGASGISSYEGITSADYVVLKSKENVNSLFFSQLFQTKTSLNKFYNYSQGSLIERLRLLYPQFSNIKMSAPSYKEQEKIATFLSSIDKKIELLEKKHQNYQEFKKYLLQNIFSQKLRFDGFNEEWKKTYLKDIGTFYRGHSYNSSNVVNEGLLVLRSNNIQNNTLNFDEDELQFVNKDCKPELNLLDGDIVICMSNGTKSLVGKSAQYNGNYNSKLTVGAFCSIFRSDFPLAPYIFQSELYKKYLYLLLAGTNINNLKNSDLEKLSLYIPSLEEQEKIANFLSSVDQKIDLLKDQISQMEDFKRGLLQSLFI